MFSEFELQLVTRAVLAAALGFVIGWERETCGSPAGDRTMALVALGAAAFTAFALHSFPDAAARIVAGIVTGVGFLGAGVVMRQSTGEVRGLTTAASVWTVASVGTIVGAGYYLLGSVLAIIVLLILAWEELPLLRRIGYRKKQRAARQDRPQ